MEMEKVVPVETVDDRSGSNRCEELCRDVFVIIILRKATEYVEYDVDCRVEVPARNAT